MSVRGSLKYLWKDIKNKLRGQPQRQRIRTMRKDTPGNRNILSVLRGDAGKSAKEKASYLNKDVDTKTDFPWLTGKHEKNRGARWDFDPLQVRSMGEEMPLTEAANDVIVHSLSQVPWQISEIDDSDEINKRQKMSPTDRKIIKASDDEKAEQLTQLLRNPDPDNDWTDLLENLVGSWLFVGCHPLIKEFSKNDDVFTGDGDYKYSDAKLGEHPIPVNIRPTADPITFIKEYNERGLIEGYWQFAQSMGARSYMERKPTYFNPEEIIWSDFKVRPWRRYGIPPTLEVLDILELLDLTIEQERLYFSQGSIPSGALNLPEWDRKEAEDFLENVKEDSKGKPWKFLPIGGGGDVDFIKFGYNFKELQFLERKKDYRKEIALAFRIPESALGTKAEDVNRATAAAEIDLKDEETVPFYMKKVERILNKYLIHPCAGKSYVFEFVPGQTEDKRKQISERVIEEFKSNLISQNEARRERGLPELEDGDKFNHEIGPDEPEGDEGPGLPFSEDKESVGKPFGDWEDFDDCVDEMMREQDYDEETARQVCGKLQDELKEKQDEPLRETDDWHEFAFQPSDVEELKEEIMEPIKEVWNEILSDEEIRDEIERMAVNGDEDDEEKSMVLNSKIMQVFQASQFTNEMSSIIQTGTMPFAMDAVEQTIAQTGVDMDPADVAPRIQERDTAFVRDAADRMADDIRGTVSEGYQEGKPTGKIVDDLKDKQDMQDQYAELVARNEMQRSTKEARHETAGAINNVTDEVYVEQWWTSEDDRVRDAHEEMHGKWKYIHESFPVDYESQRKLEETPGESYPEGLQCRCDILVVRLEDVKDEDYVGVTK